MTAEQLIDQLHRKMLTSALKLHFRKTVELLRHKAQFKTFAQEEAKQRAILDGHDVHLEPNAWINYILEITAEDFEEYLVAKIQQNNTQNAS